jgi:uncharacterized protein involved in exopolysaccharide biosynthesis
MRIHQASAYGDAALFRDGEVRRRQVRLRFPIFLVVFVVCVAASLAYVYSRPAVYESIASILVTPAANDNVVTGVPGASTSVSIAMPRPTDSGIVGVETYQLLATPLLNRVLEQIRRDGVGLPGLPDTLTELRNAIEVRPVERTNIVTLRAQGPEPAVLPVIVNTWLDVYRRSQSRIQENSASDDRIRLSIQVEDLNRRIADRRNEIADFRRRHDIVSMERDENELTARIRGLTQSLNKAKEEETQAQAHFDAVLAARRAGKPIVSLQDEDRMIVLEQRAVVLQGELKEFEQIYTQRYMEIDPKIKAVVRQLRDVEQRIAALREEATTAAFAAAERRLAETRQATKTLADEFSRSKASISDFSARFAEHKALTADLAEMEATHRQLRDQLLRREVQSERAITKVDVVETAIVPTHPIWPHYERDAAVGLGGSLVLGILSVLFFDFFRRPIAAVQTDIGTEVMRSTAARAVNVQPGPQAEITSEPGRSPPSLSYRPTPRLLEPDEAASLLGVADEETRLVAGLLLCGVSVERIAALKRADLDVTVGVISLPPPHPRTVVLPEKLRIGFERLLAGGGPPGEPVWRADDGTPRTRADLDALIVRAAGDAGLSEPAHVSANAVHHSYLVYLMRQGIRLSDLESMTGPLPPDVRAAYAAYAPGGVALPRERIDTLHPALSPRTSV